MKTMRLVSCAFAASLAAAACSTQKESPETPLAPNVFEAKTMDTKATIDSDNWTLSWEAGDAVAISDGNVYEFTAATAGPSTTLSRDGFTIDDDATYYAVFPYSAATAFSGASATINVDRDRTATAGEYPDAPAVAYTTGANRSLSFINVCGLVSFEITESDIASVVIFGNNGESLAGTITANCTDGSYSVTDVETSLLLTPSSGSTFETGRYYVAVLPQTFSNGMSVTLYKTDGTRVRRNATSSFTLSKSSHIDMESIDSGRNWKTSYTIKNADELQAFLAVASACSAETVATLANDIDMTGVKLTPATTFAGTFDGDGHSLVGWAATSPLFTATAAGSTVKNLVIASSCSLALNEDVTYESFIVGSNAGTVSGCTNKAPVTYSMTSGTALRSRRFGTIVGYSTGIVSNCINNGDITITIPKLTNTGLTYQHQNIAGVVGSFTSTSGTEAVASCINTGDITFTFEGVSDNTLRPFFNIGGVVAQGSGGNPEKSSAATNRGTVSSCSNSGSVRFTMSGINGSNYANMGGVAGYLEGTLDGCSNSGAVTFTNNESSSYKVSEPAIGGVAGNVLCGNVSGCSNTGAVSLDAYVQIGTADAAYGGGTSYPTVGGVVAKVGTTTEDTSLAVSDCTNSGAVSAKSGGAYVYVGGITGFTSIPLTGSAANKLQNSGTVTVSGEDYGLTGARVGGVVGDSESSFNTVYNTADGTVTVNLDSSTGQQVWAGGIGGYLGKASTATFKQGINNAAVNVSGGKSSSNDVSYIGGVVGKAESTTVASNGYSWVLCNSNYGDITVNCPLKVCIGGVFGQAGALSGGDGKTEQCKNRGNITAVSPKDGSIIGGVVGQHGRGQLGNGNICGLASDPVTITVTGGTSGTYVGGYVGQIRSNNGPTYPSCSTTISGIGLYVNSIDAAGTTAGVIAGNVTFVGKSTTNGIMLGSSSSERPKYNTSIKLNGTEVGALPASDSEITEANKETIFFGSITPSSTTTKQDGDGKSLAGTYYFRASGSTSAAVKYYAGLQTY